MSQCVRSSAPLLEADLAVLAGEGDSELAKHVRACGRCGGAARAILQATKELNDAVTSRPSALDVDAVLKRARLPAEGGGGPAVSRFSPAARWVALAAAAMAALMIVGEREPALVDMAPPGTGAAPPLVEPGAEQSVAIISTRNPDITIVWFFQGD